jgi:hypothetical protein
MKKHYQVKLVIDCNAESPLDAVLSFKEIMGNCDWVYKVDEIGGPVEARHAVSSYKVDTEVVDEDGRFLVEEVVNSEQF